MKKIRLTAKNFKNGKYIGEVELSNYEDYHLEIDGNLGWLSFNGGIYVKGHIWVKAGTGIKAGEGIEAGEGIKAGTGIEAGEGIKAGEGIEAGWGIKAGTGIEAGEGIKAGWGIEAGEGIEAGWGIKAGEGIKAGWGIEAGLSIRCNLTIKWAYNLFAGVAHWKKAEGADIEIEAKELLGGDLKYGKFVKTKGTVQKMYWHIHHEVLMEYLTEPLKNRIEYIKTNKPEHERDIRLKLLKAVKAPIRDYPKDHQGWESLHKKECKNCPWNGHTIFPLK